MRVEMLSFFYAYMYTPLSKKITGDFLSFSRVEVLLTQSNLMSGTIKVYCACIRARNEVKYIKIYLKVIKMKTFVRMTKLHNLKGRVDYITDEKRQENLISIINQDTDFTELIKFEKANSRSKNEGRELIVALPNEWLNLEKSELNKRVNDIVKATIGDKFDYVAAIHLNKKKSNLHTHIIFSEREKQVESFEVYKKDVYLDKNGNLAKKKEDRFELIAKKGDYKLDKNGNKIASKVTFSNKDIKFKDYNFLNDCKLKVENYYKSYDISIEKNAIPEKHVGKGTNEYTERVNKENEYVREINNILDRDKELKQIVAEKWSENKEKKSSFLENTSKFILDFINEKLRKKKEQKLQKSKDQENSWNSWNKNKSDDLER